MNVLLVKCPFSKTALTGVVAMLFFAPLFTVAAETGGQDADYKNRPLDVRVERLERLMSSQKQLELLYRMKQLQEENQQLRSLLEEQSNEIHQLDQQQRQLYEDLNRRLGQMEGGTPVITIPESVTVKEPSSAVDAKAPVAVEVVEKSKVKPSKYGATQREEIIIDKSAEKTVEPAPVSKPQVVSIKPMSEKERKAEQVAYQKAYDELRAKQYNKARDSFLTFIQKYPHGRYAHIAQYWVAESSYAQKNFKQAILDYQQLLDVYPSSPKNAEAELKKAYSYYELGEKENTRKTLKQLLTNYPDTTEAGQAKRMLKKL